MINRITLNEVVIEYIRFSRQKERVTYGSDTTEICLAGMSILELDFIEVEPLPNLRILDFSDNKLEKIELGFLRDNLEVQEIDVRKNEILTFDTTPLKKLDNLRELEISENQMKGIDLSGLMGCQSLEILNLANNHIHSLNLNPLDSCSNLIELNLKGNQLESIDLDSLNSAIGLEYLDLSHNWIREINLDSLNENHSLKRIDLSENPLSMIDLSPLQGCVSLESLVLDWTQISTLDLSPLSSCINLQKLGISHNKIKALDLTPLTKCTNLVSLDVSGMITIEVSFWPLFTLRHLEELRISSRMEPEVIAPPQSVAWPHGLEAYRKSILGQDIEDIYAVHGIQGFRDAVNKMSSGLGPLGRFFMRVAVLETFDLSYFKGYDCNINTILDKVSDSSSLEQTRESLLKIISQGLIEQVQSGGPTHFIDVELAQGIPELAVIAPKILELRKMELEQVVLVNREEQIDLLPLWETSYGFDMLGALCLGLSTDLDGIERIRTELLNEGIDLQISKDPISQSSSTDISDELREYVMMYANQCGSKQD